MNEATEVGGTVRKRVRGRVWEIGGTSPNQYCSANFQAIYPTYESGNGGDSQRDGLVDEGGR